MSAPELITPSGRNLRPAVGWQRHKGAGILAALLVLLAGIPLVFLLVKSTFIAEAVFQVAPAYQKTLTADKDLELQSNSQYREFVNHLSRSMLRYDVLERALQALNAKGIDPKLPNEDARKWIERQQRVFYVSAIPDTYMVRAGIKSDDKKDLHEIVNSVMDSFLETTRNEQIYGSDDRGRVLAQRAIVLQSEISDFETRRSNLATFLGLTTFGENSANPFDFILAQAREKLVLASIERSRAQAILAAFERQKEVPSTAGRSVMEMRLQDNGLQAMRNEVVKRNEELHRVTAGLQDGHPAKRPALDEQEDMKQRLSTQESAFEGAALNNTRARFLAAAEETRQVERELSERVTSLEGQASQYATTYREAVQYSAEIKKREQELADMRTRMNYLQTESNALGFARLITPALPAITPQGIGKTKVLLSLILVSLALTVVIPMALDYFDQRVITVGDAERAMRITSAAWIVDTKNTATRILCVDQLRRFASALQRNRARGASNVFGFSSVKVGDGTTSIVLELARTLVELGSRTLVIDANSLTRSTAMSSKSPGLTDLMIGKAKLESVIEVQRLCGADLNVVPYGLSGKSGIKRLDVLKAALTVWRDQYDTVLIDLPPLLPSADAELLIDAIGQVFLVVQAESSSKADVVRARVQLERMDPEAVGLIVNRVPVESGGKSVESQLVETITGDKFATFMSTSSMAIHWNLFLLRWQRRLNGSRG